MVILMIDTTQDKPFNKRYVISVTHRHLLSTIDSSINKTFNRSKEFSGNPKKATEVFETLSELHSMRAQINESLKAHLANKQ